MKTKLERVEATLRAFISPETDPKQALKRQRLLAAATELFVVHGYRKTSIDDVARAAGVAKGTVYLYYRNKAELLLHAAAQEKLRFLKQLMPSDSLRPVERLRACIVNGIVLSREVPLFSRITGGDQEFALVLQEVDGQVLEDIQRLQMEFLAALIDEATEGNVPPARLAQKAAVLVDLMLAVVAGPRFACREMMSLEQFAHEVANAIVDGIVTDNATRMGAQRPGVRTARMVAGASSGR